jgi:hypothetical protein
MEVLVRDETGGFQPSIDRLIKLQIIGRRLLQLKNGSLLHVGFQIFSASINSNEFGCVQRDRRIAVFVECNSRFNSGAGNIFRFLIAHVSLMHGTQCKFVA